jgi:hypothetical protein
MEVQTSIYVIIEKAVSALRADPTFGPRLSNKWLPTNIWVDALAKSRLIDRSFVIDCKRFNKAMSSSKTEWGEAMLHFDGTNKTGVFRVKFHQQFFYYFTERGKQVPYYPSPLDAAWKGRVLAAAANVLIIPTTRSRPAVKEEVRASDELDSRPAAEVRTSDAEIDLRHDKPHQRTEGPHNTPVAKVRRSDKIDSVAEVRNKNL